MTPQFRLTEPAIQDIEQIADYIARESGFDRAVAIEICPPCLPTQTTDPN